jgi:hypothetical protein
MSEWIKYEKTWEEFGDAGLNKPGTLICVQDFNDLSKQHVFLIGDVNVLAGLCDCCRDMHDKQTVIRYRVLEIKND